MATKKKTAAKAKPKSKPKTASKVKVKARPKAKAAPAVVRPVKEVLTKSALLNLIAERHDITRKQASEIFGTLEALMLGSVHPSGAGEFIMPGLFKITLRKVPARKAGTLIRNPATGEMMKAAAKPASVRVKMRPLSKLKAAAVK